MKNTIFFIFLLASNFSFAEKKNSTFYAANNHKIKYTGRIDFTNPTLPRFWQPGVYINIKFKGTDCRIILNDEMLWGKNHNYVEIILDGKEKRIQTKAATDTIIIGETLGAGTHELTIVKNTEANIGYLEFGGIICEKLLAASANPLRKIEFIGDSITCGASSDTSSVPCGKGVWQDQHNAYLSYGGVTARSLNAQYHINAVSGIGLIHSCCNMKEAMPQLYDNISMRDDTIQWQFKNYIPDVVTVCLGQNDGVQDSAAFCNAYVNFLKKIRTNYPSSKIICLTSPMADATLKSFMIKMITSVVKKMNDKNVSSFFFANQYINGCDSHPSVSDHAKIAEELITGIKKVKGW